MTGPAAHEARHEVTIKAALDLGLQAWRTTGSRERFIEAHDAVNALAADLSVARAQVERMREALQAVWDDGFLHETVRPIVAAALTAVPDPGEDACG